MGRTYFNDANLDTEEEPVRDTKQKQSETQQRQQQQLTQQSSKPQLTGTFREDNFTQESHGSRNRDNYVSPKFSNVEDTGRNQKKYRLPDQEDYSNVGNIGRFPETVPAKMQSHPTFFVSLGKSKGTPSNKQAQNTKSSANFSRKRDLVLSHATIEPKKEQKPYHSSKYDHVQSKIKGKVDLDKQLSRQYKKSKGALNNRSDDEGYETMQADESQGYYGQRDYYGGEKSKGTSKFVFLDKDDNRNRPVRETESRYMRDYRQQQESHRLEASSDEKPGHLIESNSSARNQFRSSPDYQMNRTTPMQDSQSKESQAQQYSATKSDDFSQSRGTQLDMQDRQGLYYANQPHSLAGAGSTQNNILDIANNFLNSPLMHHLSNQENRTFELSSKDSNSYPNTLKSNANVTDFENRSPSAFTRSPNSRRYYDEEHKSSQDQPHRYSDWVGTYDFSKSRDQPSYLKESTNKRHSDYKPKDSGN